MGLIMKNTYTNLLNSNVEAKKWLLSQEFVLPPTFIYSNQVKPLLLYFGGRFVDRTGSIDMGFKPKIIFPLPTEMPTGVPDFDYIMNERGKQLGIESKNLNKPISVLWSGGLDSTAVCCSLLENNVPFTIVYTAQSLEENQQFYDDCLKDNSLVQEKLVESPLGYLAEEGENTMCITGECGAHLMGTISWQKFIPGAKTKDGIIQDNADAEGKLLLGHNTPLYGVPEKWAYHLRSVLDYWPGGGFKSNYDALWWVTFATKWQAVYYRFTLFSGKLQPYLRNFYLTDEFAAWAMANDSTVKCPSYEWNNYKMPMRDYIFQYTCNKAVYTQAKYASMPRSEPRITTGEFTNYFIGYDHEMYFGEL